MPGGRPEQPLPQQKGISIIEEPYRPGRPRQPGPQRLADISAIERFELAHAGEEGNPSVVIERPGDGYAPGRPGRRGERPAATQDVLQQFLCRGRGPQGAPADGAADDGAGAYVDERGRHVRATDVHDGHQGRTGVPAARHRTNALTIFTDLGPRGRSQ